MTDLLDVGARRTLPAWTGALGLVAATVAGAVWTVLAALPPTIDGHGAPPARPPHVAYQPLLGHPLI